MNRKIISKSLYYFTIDNYLQVRFQFKSQKKSNLIIYGSTVKTRFH